MKIATWNVNSIRSRIPRLVEWLNEEKPDVMLIQELKCTNENFPFLEFEQYGYNIQICGEKGKNGVAIFSKFPLYDIVKKLPLYGLVEVDEEARYIEAKFDYNGKVYTVASIYVPNGGPTANDIRNGVKDLTSTEVFTKKMKFNDRLQKRFQESINNNEICFFCGDYNVCPVLEMDVYSVEKDGSITNTWQEREKFKNLLSTGVCDIWRKFNPTSREYSWFGYRPYYMWERKLGYRLDAILTTPEATKLVKNCKIYAEETRGKEQPSDHCPMMCEI